MTRSPSSVQEGQWLNANNNMTTCTGKFTKYRIARIILFSISTIRNVWNKIMFHRQVIHSFQRKYNQYHDSPKPNGTPDSMQSASPLPPASIKFHTNSFWVKFYTYIHQWKSQAAPIILSKLFQHYSTWQFSLYPSCNSSSRCLIKHQSNLSNQVRLAFWKLTHCLQNATCESQSWTSSCWKCKGERINLTIRQAQSHLHIDKQTISPWYDNLACREKEFWILNSIPPPPIFKFLQNIQRKPTLPPQDTLSQPLQSNLCYTELNRELTVMVP